MRRVIYFLMSDKHKVETEIEGFSNVVKKLYTDSVLLSKSDVLVFMTHTNGYVVTGSVYNGDLNFLREYIKSYDLCQLVIDISLFDKVSLRESLSDFCSEIYSLSDFRRRSLITLIDVDGLYMNDLSSLLYEQSDSQIVFLKHPLLLDVSAWNTQETSVGSYDVGNIIWRTYAGRHAEIEDMCFSDKRSEVFVGEVLARCFNLEEINSCFLKVVL